MPRTCPQDPQRMGNGLGQTKRKTKTTQAMTAVTERLMEGFDQPLEDQEFPSKAKSRWSFEWPRAGVPNLWDLRPGEVRWSWFNNNRNKVHNKWDALESFKTIPRPCPRLWKNCLPRNWSLGPKRLGTAALENLMVKWIKERVLLARDQHILGSGWRTSKRTRVLPEFKDSLSKGSIEQGRWEEKRERGRKREKEGGRETERWAQRREQRNNKEGLDKTGWWIQTFSWPWRKASEGF